MHATVTMLAKCKLWISGFTILRIYFYSYHVLWINLSTVRHRQVPENSVWHLLFRGAKKGLGLLLNMMTIQWCNDATNIPLPLHGINNMQMNLDMERLHKDVGIAATFEKEISPGPFFTGHFHFLTEALFLSEGCNLLRWRGLCTPMNPRTRLEWRFYISGRFNRAEQVKGDKADAWASSKFSVAATFFFSPKEWLSDSIPAKFHAS